jgi:hypothetical protein
MVHINICLVSPLAFLGNVLLAYLYEELVYATLFLNLTVSSIYYHTHYSLLSNIYDKCSISSVVLYGGARLLVKLTSVSNITHYFLVMTSICSFVGTNILYFYGKKHKVYCFDSDSKKAYYYHAILHLLSACGHASIIAIR